MTPKGKVIWMDRDEILRTLVSHRRELEKRGIRSLSVFGSVARGETGANSDVDVLVELSPEAHVGLFGLVDLKEFLEATLGRPVDVVTPDGLRIWMRERVLGEAVRVI